MNPLKLTLKNFTGIRAGLGRDEVTIDLEIVGELVAVVGPNGAGKTTVLDNLHPYRLMPSRASGYAPGSFSYYDHTYGNAAKVLLWEHAGATYESSIIIKGANKTKSQECYLHEVRADGTKRAVVLPDNTVSDGKSATYDACVSHILGSPELFFTTAFACQGRRTLADYTNSDVKSLMSELLGLDSIREVGERAKGIAASARAKLEAIGDARARLDAIQARYQAVCDELVDASATASAREARLGLVGLRIEQAQQRLLVLRQDHAGAALVAQQREQLRKRFAAESAELQAQFAAMEKRHQAAIDAAKKGKRDATSNYQAAASRVKECGRDIEALESKIADRPVIEARMSGATAEANEIPALEAKIAEVERDIADYVRAHMALTEASGACQAAAARAKSASMAFEDAERRGALVQQVPCAGMELQSRCQLLADAVDAHSRVDALRAEFEQSRAAHAASQAAHDAAIVARGKRIDPSPRLPPLKARLREAQAAHASLSGLQAKLDAIGQAEAELAEDQIRLGALEEEAAELSFAVEYAMKAVVAASEEAERDADATRAENRRRLAAIEAEIAALPEFDDSALRAAHVEFTEAEGEKEALELDLHAIRAKIAVAKERSAALLSDIEDTNRDVARHDRVAGEVAQWTLLAKACGNDGVIALCIDDAGPAITGICNDLLLACYGPRFSVSIETQRETQSGVAKETFDIRVFDADRDASKSIRDVSGGERVYINEAMTRAMALYQAQASGRHYECLFADESDGALDHEKKRQFAAMKRRVLEIGGYKREIYISHSAEVQEAADAIIDMEALR